ncbi:MAG: tail-specific protease, partial [Xanthomonadales bacterium]|nr:tail-specific protease [Xanthomonadales bacterium]NIX11549.1 tail-specific protease [Xanthomonadales bacterium]
AGASVPADEAISLKPSMDQLKASNLATRFLTNWHYKDTSLDDMLSIRIFDGYLELLDPNRSYFLATDIASFQRFRKGLDDSLRYSDLSPAYTIFNVYAERVRQRAAFANAQLDTEFDFTVDEYYEFDRSESRWAANEQELDEIWRKRVKNDYLRLLLTGKERANIVETLAERYENIDRRISELKSEDIFQFFMNAFAQAIEPHTAYLSPRSSENFEIYMKLSLEGIGALLGRESEYTSIQSIVPGGPADQDGRLQAGDRLLAVGQGMDGKLVDVIGWRVDDVVDLIRGPKDTIVRLEVLPEDAGVDGPSTVIEIVRNEVKLEEQAAKSEIIEVPREGAEPMKIGVIDLPVFYLDFNGRASNRPDYRSSTRDVRRLIEELKKEGVEGLVVDLRQNGGGSLLEATTLTGLFIDQGPVVQVQNSSGAISTEEDTSPGMAWDGPLAVLVNRYSASASEIFAAAIQDYGRGLVIGETTFGKGTVQSLLDLDDYASSDLPSLGQLKITMAQFFRINGGSTQNRGVVPDIVFPSAGDPDEYGERSLDNALPWTRIEPADYNRVGDLGQMVAVTDFRFQGRVKDDQEFAWLISDIEEFNARREDHKVSLNEATRRQEMADKETKRKERQQLREDAGPLLEDMNTLAVEDPTQVTDEEDADEEEQEDERPDLLLRESARIVADMVELDADTQLLAKQFSLLLEESTGSKLN